MSILVFNAGSSTLKFALFDNTADNELCGGMVDWIGQHGEVMITLRSPPAGQHDWVAELAGYDDAVGEVLRMLIQRGFDEPIQAVGHRVVHGGTEFRRTVLIDSQVTHLLQKLSQLAPLHNPPMIETLHAVQEALPDVPQVAVFDTSFFADLPERAFIYPVPYDWYVNLGIRRFGFHGISHEYCAVRAAGLLDRSHDKSLRLIVCHLGNGASATAVRGGRPIATSMGFTPLEGLMMGTRSGSIDSGIIFHLMQKPGFSAKQLDEDLNRRSGLLGVSGVSSDYREVERAADAGNHRAQLAIEMFADRIRSAIGSLAVTLGGVDGLVFTAGIGENSASLRAQVCLGIECLGLLLDESKNDHCEADCDIATPDSAGRILVIRTREEQMVACQTKQIFVNAKRL